MRDLCKRKVNYKESGITLIALVVTIVVLLVLAGISINMVMGQHGILQRAKDAKTLTEDRQIQEQIRLATMSAMAYGNGNITEALLIQELNNQFGVNGYSLLDNGDSWDVRVNSIVETVLKTEEEECGIDSEILNNLVIGANIIGYDPSVASDGSTLNMSYSVEGTDGEISSDRMG